MIFIKWEKVILLVTTNSKSICLSGRKSLEEKKTWRENGTKKQRNEFFLFEELRKEKNSCFSITVEKTQSSYRQTDTVTWYNETTCKLFDKIITNQHESESQEIFSISNYNSSVTEQISCK